MVVDVQLLYYKTIKTLFFLQNPNYSCIFEFQTSLNI